MNVYSETVKAVRNESEGLKEFENIQYYASLEYTRRLGVKRGAFLHLLFYDFEL